MSTGHRCFAAARAHLPRCRGTAGRELRVPRRHDHRRRWFGATLIRSGPMTAARRGDLRRFLATVARYDDFLVFCYGSYEKTFLTRMRKLTKKKKEADRVLKSLVNTLSLVYTHFYFPTYSNGLKDCGRCLGCSWTDPGASGVQSIAWRIALAGNERKALERQTYGVQSRRLRSSEESNGIHLHRHGRNRSCGGITAGRRRRPYHRPRAGNRQIGTRSQEGAHPFLSFRFRAHHQLWPL